MEDLRNTVLDIVRRHWSTIGDTKQVYGRLLISMYALFSTRPSQKVIAAVNLPTDDLQSILSEEQFSFLKENYADVISLLVRDKTIRDLYSDIKLVDPFAIISSLNNSYSKWKGLVILGAGLSHYLIGQPQYDIYGVELNPLFWGLGQVYIDATGIQNVFIFQELSELPVNKTFDCTLLLSDNQEYFRYVKKGLGGSYEIMAVLPREFCYSASYLEHRRTFLDSGRLQSITVVHAATDGIAIVYCLDSFKRRQRNTSLLSEKIARQAVHMLFPRQPGKSMLLLTGVLAILFLLNICYLLLASAIPSFGAVSTARTMFGTSALLFMISWMASWITAKEKDNPEVQFTAVLKYSGASLSDWEALTCHSLQKQSGKVREQTLYYNASLNKRVTVFSRYFSDRKSLSETDLRAFVYAPEEDCKQLSELVTFIQPIRISNNVARPALRIVNGYPLSENHINSEIDEEKFSEASSVLARYYIPADTYLWCYMIDRLRIGHVSQEVALSYKFKWNRTLLFVPVSHDIEKDYLLKELLSGFIQEQLLWLGTNPSNDELSRIRIRVPSIERQNRELRADAFEYLEREHKSFVAMVTNHKHEVGNLLKFLYYDFDILKLLLEAQGHISLDDIVDSRKGSTVRDYFLSIDGYKTAIGQEMINFWNEGYGKEDVFNLKNEVDSFLKTKATSPYSIDTVIPNDTNIFFSKKGLSTILRNVFVNAEKHGFTDKSKKDYFIKIWQENIQIDGQDFARMYVANNGNPLPEGITQHNMFDAGTGTGDSEHIGCHTIKEICNEFGGYVSFEQYHENNDLSVSYIFDLPKA